MERYNYIDYAKALCIAVVVYTHTGFSALHSVILFTMPLFFAATGYTFSYGKRSLRENAARRFKSIMLPYFLLMLFYTLVEVVRAGLFGYGDASIAYPSLVNTVYGSGVLPLNGGIFDVLKEIMSYKAQPLYGVDLILPTNCHLWFLPAMFTAYVIFILLVRPGRAHPVRKAATLLALVLLASAEVVFPQLCQLPFGLGRGAMGAAFMLFGFWIRESGCIENRSGTYCALTNIFALALFVGAVLLGSDGSAFVRSVYGPCGFLSVVITFVGGAAGVWIILSLCRLMEKLPWEKFKKMLVCIGRNVMTVYVWHMAVKFLFDAVYLCLIKGSDFSLLDGYKMGLMPQTSMWFMLFEGAAVIAVCLLFGKIRPRLKI